MTFLLADCRRRNRGCEVDIGYWRDTSLFLFDDLMDWARWYEKAERHVLTTQVTPKHSREHCISRD